jgi:cytochrome c-type biogenesis protein CcmH
LNVVFWLIASAMVLVAFLIVLPPLWRKQGQSIEDDLDQRNVKIARDRLAELNANKASGGISQEQYDEQVAELELTLSDDLDIPDATEKRHSQGRWLVYVLVVAVPVISATLYWTLGDYQAISRINDPNQANLAGQQDQPNQPSPEAIKKMVAKLADKLKNEPNNLEGWLMLGRSYKVLENYPEAVDAFAHAYQLAGDKPDVMLAYAESLAFSKNGDWGGKAKEMVMKAITLEPDNLTGLWFAAMATAQQGDKPTAVGYLKKLDAALPPDSPDKQQIHDLIANAEGKAGKVTSDKPTETTTSSKSQAIAINVSLAEELKQKVSQEDTLFIYAQAVSGPKMPLAIVRKKVSDLPVSVSLSDADSMMPAMKLSNFKEIRLLARISKTGNPMPQPDDLIGAIEQANLADNKPYTIVIDGRVK